MKNLIIVCLFSLLSVVAFPQGENKSSIWINAGTGLSFMQFTDVGTALNFSLALNYDNQNNNVCASYMHAFALELFSSPDEYVNSFEVKYGRSLKFKMRGLLFPMFPFLLLLKKQFEYTITGRVGLSYTNASKWTKIKESEFLDVEYNTELLHSIGLPIEIEIREDVTSDVCFGLVFYTNINKVMNFSGVNFNIYFLQKKTY